MSNQKKKQKEQDEDTGSSVFHKGDHLSSTGGAPYRVSVSKRFLFLSLIPPLLLAFGIGRVTRVLLIDRPYFEALQTQQALLLVEQRLREEQSSNPISDAKLPSPTLQGDKVHPHSIYTSKNFDTSKATTSNSRWIVTEAGKEECEGENAQECPASIMDTDGDGNEETEELHLPAGQHLLMDFEHVDYEFLNSEERLATAMLALVNSCGLTLLSYHCHSLMPSGVSCAGVLLESHVSFHTWPEKGVITLDLYTCGPKSLLPTLDLAESLFGIPQPGSTEEPNMVYLYKLRGFRDNGEGNANLSDMMHFPVGMRTDYKREVVAVESPFQSIDIYDVLKPRVQSYESFKLASGEDTTSTDDDSYESQNPQYFQPDRMLFLDGVLQARLSGDSAYYEALVNPAMFAHENPKRVAIIGGGEGGILREVLKHNTVEKVVMVEVDELILQISQENFPSWNDCSTLVGSAPLCAEDPRVEIHLTDAFEWFVDRFTNKGSKSGTEDVFDVVIMDALDAEAQKDFTTGLYANSKFLTSLRKSLDKEGILVTQVGKTPYVNSPSEQFSTNRNRFDLINSLKDNGFGHIRSYEESHCGFSYPWEYIIAFKKFHTKAYWYTNEAEINIQMRRRSMQAVDGSTPFHYFDGASMMSYLYPSKTSEIVYCRQIPRPKGCESGHGFELAREDIPIDALEVGSSSIGEKAGRGVFATRDIRAKSYMGLKSIVHQAIHASPSSYALINEWYRPKRHWTYYDYGGECLVSFIHGYGHLSNRHGDYKFSADGDLHTFINHGCDAGYNTGYDLGLSEKIADPDSVPDDIFETVRGKGNVYNPLFERQVHFYSTAIPHRSIRKGEELLDNYLGRTGIQLGQWRKGVNALREQCQGGGIGFVTRYEAAVAKEG